MSGTRPKCDDAGIARQILRDLDLRGEAIIPNGRRDHFEQNVHFHNLLTHLSPIARELSTKCRLSSIARNRSREFQGRVQIGKEKLAIIKQRSLGRRDQARLLREVYGLIADLEKLATADAARLQQDGLNPAREIQKLKRAAMNVASAERDSSLKQLPKSSRLAFEKVFSLIYECAPNRVVAKALVDRVMARLRRGA